MLVRTTGAKVSRGKLRQLVPVFQERTVDRSLLVEGRRNLVEYFQSQGYFNAAVEFQESAKQDDREVIDYTVTLNQRNSWLKWASMETSISMTKPFASGWRSRRREISAFTSATIRKEILDRDLDSIRDLYHSNGFRDAGRNGPHRRRL